MIGNSSAIGEEIGTEVGTDLTGGGGIDTDDGSSTESIEDPPRFIPAEPYDLLPGYCCGTGPYNETTVEHHLKNSTGYVKITKAAVVNRVMPCPSRLYPNRPTEKDCYNYELRYYTITKQVSQRHHCSVTREYACKDDVTVCCSDYIPYQGHCFTQEQCDQQNWLNRLMGLPEDCGV